MRLEITRRAELAIRALAFLGSTTGRVKASVLAKQLGATVGFVPQILGPLVKEGLVHSDPGPTGGYTLVAELDTVSVLQVIEAVDGVTDAGRCVVKNQECRNEAPCVLHTAWTRARDELVGVLRATPMSAVGPDLP